MDQINAAEAGQKLLRAEQESNQSDLEVFGQDSGFEVSLRLPRIIFRSISTKPDAHWLRQIAIATVRRFFYLTEDWSINLRSDRYPAFSGTIVVPEKTDGERFEFDGASIPVPWLVSMITIGILRPLGVLLIASLVHDYAFRYGYLKVRKQDGTTDDMPIERHEADSLFRDIITVVNGNRTVGQLAWYFVRLGYWLGVKYNGQPRTGQAPYLVGASFLALLLFLGLLISHYSLPVVVLSAAALYLSVYVLTLHQLRALSATLAIALVSGILLIYIVALRYIST